LQLERPLVAFDIESTGLNVSKDRILEIAAVKVWPNGKVSQPVGHDSYIRPTPETGADSRSS
jgi:DNA polymerase-3 subunit epsilon